jgi:hypothetical protein
MRTDSKVQNSDPSPERPAILSVLCILSFAFGAFKIILFFSAAILFIHNTALNSGLTGMLNALLSIKSTFDAIVWIVLTLVLVHGSWLMWHLRKIGFYIYFFAAIFAYLLPAIHGGAEMMTIERLFFSSIFVFFYGLHLKFMK